MKIIHNGQTSHDLLIRIKGCEPLDPNEMASWLAAAPDWPNQNKRFCQFGPRVVAGTLDDDAIDEDSGEKKNEVLVVIHDDACNNGWLFDNATTDEDELLILEEHKTSAPVLSAEAVCEKLKSSVIPKGILSIGVSAVSMDLAAEVWAEIITPHRSWMDGEGKGYMVHPMFSWHIDSVIQMRETSFRFGAPFAVNGSID